MLIALASNQGIFAQSLARALAAYTFKEGTFHEGSGQNFRLVVPHAHLKNDFTHM